MKKLHELLKQRPSGGDIGIEIETEGENLVPINTDLWRTEDDGSLRGNYPNERAEFVLKRPVKISQVGNSVRILREHQQNATINFSFRCSVHIHVNVGDLTLPEFLAYLYLCFLVEEPLMNLCGEARKGNRFCLRMSDAEGYLDYLNSWFAGGLHPILDTPEDRVRYSAINIGSVKKYGSLEFRGMHGTMDEKTIEALAQTLFRMKLFAKKLGDPIAVHDAFVKVSNEVFAKKAFGKHSELFGVQGDLSGMSRSYSLTLELPYSYRRLEIKLKEEEKVIEQKEVNAIDLRAPRFNMKVAGQRVDQLKRVID